MATMVRNAESTLTTIALDPGDYWKLLKLEADLTVAKTTAQIAIGRAESARAQHLRVVAEKYPGFVAEDGHYTSDDATCSLTRRT